MKACNVICNSYYHGDEGLAWDEKKAKHYYELAAVGGNAMPRYNLAKSEEEAGNTDRELKHYFIAVGMGDNLSLKSIREMYMLGEATKDDYMKGLRIYQAYLEEIKSPQRDETAAFDDICKYY